MPSPDFSPQLPEDAPVAVILWAADEGDLDEQQVAAIGESASRRRRRTA